MSRLVALFQKGFMRLTGGRRVVLLGNDEVVLTEQELDELLDQCDDNAILKEEVQKLQAKCIEEYSKGWVAGTDHSLPLTCEIPQDGKLLAMISLIAKELIEQADVESCEWLFEKLHQCRSL